MKKVDKVIATAETISTELTKLDGLEVNADVRGLVIAECKKAGVTIEELCRVLAEGLKSTKGTVDKYGDMHVEDDFLTRHKFMVTGLELMGYLKVKADGANVNILNISTAEKEELEMIRAGIYGKTIEVK